MITRRIFMGALTATVAAGSVGVGIFATGRRPAPLEIRGDTATLLRGDTVRLHGRDGSTMRALVDAVSFRHHPARPGAPGTEQISLLFAADGRAGFYKIDHADLDLDELYLSPVGMPGRNRRLEAVITRIV